MGYLATRKTGRLTALLLSVTLVGYALLTRRVFLQFETGGRGVLPVLDIVACLVVASVSILPWGPRSGFWRSRRFWLSCGLYSALSILLPCLGVIGGEYSPTSLLAVLGGILPVAFVATGYYVAQGGPAALRILRRCILIAVVVQALYATAQFIEAAAHYSGPFLSRLAAWDQLSQAAYGGTYGAQRSTGLYLNPNELGLWSVVAFWAGITLFTGKQRTLAVSAAVITLALSQSRGSLFALGASLCVLLIYEVIKLSLGRGSPRERPRGALSPLAGALAVVLMLALLLRPAVADSPAALVMQQRFASGVSVLSDGLATDANLAARLSVWATVPRFIVDHPFGTLGPPQLLFTQSIDNEFLRLFLQGGIVYLLSVFLILLYTIPLMRSERPESRCVGLVMIALAVNAITALPLAAPPMALVWALLGSSLVPVLRSTAQHAIERQDYGKSETPLAAIEVSSATLALVPALKTTA